MDTLTLYLSGGVYHTFDIDLDLKKLVNERDATAPEIAEFKARALERRLRSENANVDG